MGNPTRRAVIAGSAGLISALGAFRSTILAADMDPKHMKDPVIIEVALNGAAPIPNNPNVPRTPREVTEDALECIAAGASIIHSHTNDPVVGGGTGRHDPAPLIDAWAPVLDKHPDVLFYPTMQGGGRETTITDRASHMQTLIDEGLMRFALIDMGTTNVSVLGIDGLPVKTDAVFINTAADAHYMFDFCARNRVGASIGCIEPGYARTVMAFSRVGKVPQGSMFRLMFGGPSTLVGLPATEAALDVFLGMIKEAGLPWNVAVTGGNVFDNRFARLALERGGHLRVGLEDYRSTDGPRNAELVERATKLAAELGRPVATPAETAEILGLPRVQPPEAKSPGERQHP